jgi:hypothetical protein
MPMIQKLVQEIKRAFWSLCGAISTEELTTNAALIDSIRRIEKELAQLTR